ncbi:hypothetical protein BTN49_1740 [Candidatus Enterovibrio escicola]|uniref:Uncharacterized protein n=1 Tax=Candidatus Enterovibrio escicola TaxID=1927127 RepID=A0A2A5T3P7_9GAMM|nr:hypothetical protein BTN49_1740 [Candidatus Enterovibrio escacola]
MSKSTSATAAKGIHIDTFITQKNNILFIINRTSFSYL